MNPQVKLILKKGKEQSVKRRHPWIFSGAISKMSGKPAEGDVVSVFSDADEFLAWGHYQIGSIAVRLFSFREEYPDDSFWYAALEKALNLRIQLGLAENPATTVYRLVNAEGDDLPGLVIDFYNGTAVMQMHSIGMYKMRYRLAAMLREIYGNRLEAVFDKCEFSIPKKAGLDVKNGFLWGDKHISKATENNLFFEVDVLEGQKTGFFIDQRDNRRLLSSCCEGRDVLNMFCYTGGFSVYAAMGKARVVHSVDSSAPAIDLTGKNMALNGYTGSQYQAVCTDAFAFMKDIKDRYDIIVLDPPAFAKHHDALGNALQAYKRMNQLALEQIKSGGLLFTFSCSQVVSRENFRKSVFAAAANSRRQVRILHQLTQPPDHPVSIFHPEGEYLKGIVLHVN
jgi:23S rRNA (cytosine1962-C5)-methyltransferase